MASIGWSDAVESLNRIPPQCGELRDQQAAPRDASLLGLVNDPYFVLLILFCAAVITIGALVTALSRVRRAEFARLQNELRELSQRVIVLKGAEQRRFVREINSRSEGAEATHTTNGSDRLEAEGEAAVQANARAT